MNTRAAKPMTRPITVDRIATAILFGLIGLSGVGARHYDGSSARGTASSTVNGVGLRY